MLPQSGKHASARQALFNSIATRRIEQSAKASLPAHALMQRAGLATARLAMALAPHAQTIWLACGPGNNGGDGLEAALHLKQWGKTPVVTWLGDTASVPADAARSCQRAIDAGVEFASEPPANFDFGVDAILGLGAQQRAGPIALRMAQWIDRLNQSTSRVLAVDLPTGLNCDTGAAAPQAVRAFATLSLLTLKPGLFTASGRDQCGDIWLDTLNIATAAEPSAWLSGPPRANLRDHASHKGSFGDVAVVGGAPGMTGAALLAAQAALHFGAGRVFVSLLNGDGDGNKAGRADSTAAISVHPLQPELMFSAWSTLNLTSMTVVVGCGGGNALHGPLIHILQSDAKVVIDADGLNAIAESAQLQSDLLARAARGLHTVLTPHPLEAARLLKTTAAAVQHDRIHTAQTLADQWRCTVALKGSGTVVAAPGMTPSINPTGNAKLATAGTGDVLAGMVGACLARYAKHNPNGGSAFDNADNQATYNATYQVACDAVFVHGQTADDWSVDGPSLTASGLAGRLKI